MYKLIVSISTFALISFAAQIPAIASGENSSSNSSAQQASSSPAQESSPTPNAMQNRKARRSNLVSVVLNDTNRARYALANDNTEQAKQDVNRALAAAERLGNNRMVPLYSELDEYSVLGPIEASRTAIQNSPNTNTSNTPEGSSNRAPVQALAVNKVEGQFTSVDLDSGMAIAHLQAAQQALANGNVRVANAALKAVQDGVILVSVGSDLPLLRARENLVLARMDARQAQYQKAHLDLQAACHALTAYEEEGGPNSSQAKALGSEIASYNQSIQSDHANASSKIESFWNQTTDLMTPINRPSSAS